MAQERSVSYHGYARALLHMFPVPIRVFGPALGLSLGIVVCYIAKVIALQNWQDLSCRLQVWHAIA